MSFYHGISAIIHPHPLDQNTYMVVGLGIHAMWINLAILVGAMLAEGKACLVALRAFAHEAKEHGGVFKALRGTKDPTVPAVIVEDSAAVLGLAVAFICQCMAYYFNLPWIDAVGSIIIGLILLVASVFLIWECRSLAMNEAVDEETVAEIVEYVENSPRITKVCEIKTTHIGPEVVLVCMSVDFNNDISAHIVERNVGLMRDGIEAIIARNHGSHVKTEVYINVESFNTFGEGFIPDDVVDYKENADV
jgi:divalent metal cation (Fe/Co/Zn/Cd) transporter